MVVWIEILDVSYRTYYVAVTTCVVVWIEISEKERMRISRRVTTCVVVWIEIVRPGRFCPLSQSPPAWWCGLKFLSGPCPLKIYVTTCVVVWIEIRT